MGYDFQDRIIGSFFIDITSTGKTDRDSYTDQLFLLLKKTEKYMWMSDSSSRRETVPNWCVWRLLNGKSLTHWVFR